MVHDSSQAHDLALPLLTAELLQNTRSSVKWADREEGLLPLFIAEMDFPLAPEISTALIDQIERSDLGYAEDVSELATAFSNFSNDRWGWCPDPADFYSATDVSFGIKAALRHMLPPGSRVALTTPVYPSFFGYLTELGFECVEIPLIGEGAAARIDVDAIEASFAGKGQQPVQAVILSNPHNPHGIAHSRADLEALATAAAKHAAFIVSDEIHAPLTHHGVEFTPFAPLAEAAGTPSVTVTSASKGWNIAGTKSALVYAPTTLAPDSLRAYLLLTLNYSMSILGRTANTVAFRDCGYWLDAVISQVEDNAQQLTALLQEHVPRAKYTPPRAGYLAWVDLTECDLGESPAQTIFERQLVKLSDGALFGAVGKGWVRLNLGCAPELLREAVRRIGAAVDND